MRIQVFLFSILLFSVARADVITLNNGSEIKGKILEEDSRRIVIKTRGGKVTFPRHMVESVKRDAPKKKVVPTSGGAPKGAELGGGINLWRDLGGVVRAGERWVFTLRYHNLSRDFHYYHGKLPPTWKAPRGRRSYTQHKLWPHKVELGLTFIGLESIEAIRTWSGPRLPHNASEQVSELREANFALGKPDRFGRKPSPYGLQSHQKTTKVVLEVSGRRLNCLLTERPHRSEKTWYYAPQGEVRWPGVLKKSFGKIVVRELVEILPPKAPAPRTLPVDAGDSLVYRIRQGATYTTTSKRVDRVCPEEVAIGEERWKRSLMPLAQRAPKLALRVLREEALSIGGKTYNTLVTAEGSTPPTLSWWHIDDQGRERFPGVLKRRRGSETLLQFVRYERGPARGK